MDKENKEFEIKFRVEELAQEEKKLEQQLQQFADLIGTTPEALWDKHYSNLYAETNQRHKKVMDDLAQDNFVSAHFFKSLGLDAETDNLALDYLSYFAKEEARLLCGVPSSDMSCLKSMVWSRSFIGNYLHLKSLREAKGIKTEPFEDITKRIFG